MPLANSKLTGWRGQIPCQLANLKKCKQIWKKKRDFRKKNGTNANSKPNWQRKGKSLVRVVCLFVLFVCLYCSSVRMLVSLGFSTVKFLAFVRRSSFFQFVHSPRLWPQPLAIHTWEPIYDAVWLTLKFNLKIFEMFEIFFLHEWVCIRSM